MTLSGLQSRFSAKAISSAKLIKFDTLIVKGQFMKAVLAGYITIFFVSLTGCSSGGSDSSEPVTSSSSSSSSSSGVALGSHRRGENCLESGCHGVGISGDGPEFYVGGTVYKSDGSAQANATIRFYVKDTNNLLATLQTDQSGNFYTSQVISELHIPNGPPVISTNVTLEGPSGGLQTMPGDVADAHCNVCHVSGDVGRLVAN